MGRVGSVNAERDSPRHSHLPGCQCWLQKLGRINNSSASRDRASYHLCFKYLPLGHELIDPQFQWQPPFSVLRGDRCFEWMISSSDLQMEKLA